MSSAPQLKKIHNVVEPDSAVVAVFEALQTLDFAALQDAVLQRLVPGAAFQGLVPPVLAGLLSYSLPSGYTL